VALFGLLVLALLVLSPHKCIALSAQKEQEVQRVQGEEQGDALFLSSL